MKKKEAIFEKFSKNLQIIKNFWQIDFNEAFNNESYICPLSLKIHTKEGLSDKYADQLTLEHIPPESLNGKPLCLTNKVYNSLAGHTLDIALLNHIKLKEFHEGLSPLPVNGYFDNVKVKSSFNTQDKDNPVITLDLSQGHYGIKKVENKLKNKDFFKFTFKMPNDDRKFMISLLRTAYLMAFSHLGYSLIFGTHQIINQSYELIRRQILNPGESIIEDIFPFYKNLNNNPLGLYIVHEPKELRALFVLFSVETENSMWRYGIFLPGPDEYGLKPLSELRNKVNQKEKITFQSLPIPRIDLTNKDDSIKYYKMWADLNGSS